MMATHEELASRVGAGMALALALATPELPRLLETIARHAGDVLAATCVVEIVHSGVPVEARPPASVVLPLWARGRAIGALVLARGPAEEPFDADDLAVAHAFAEHAAVAIANAQLLVEARQESAEAARQLDRLRVLEGSAHEQAAAIATAESRFAQLFQSSIIGMLANHLDGPIVDINAALLGMVGYSRDELLSGAVIWGDLTPPEWRGVDATAFDQLMRTGIGDLREKEYLHKRGHRVPVLVGSVMLAGGRNDCISFVLDLTERKIAQTAIAELRREQAADRTFRDLLEAAPDAMVIVDPSGAIVFVNGQLETMFGYAGDEVIGQQIEILIPERHRAAHPAHRAGYVREPTNRRVGPARCLCGRRKDGSEFPIEVSLSPLRTDDGLLVSSAIRDITERTKFDQQRAQLAAIVEASADAIVGKTLAGVVTSWNPGAQRMFGYTADEIVGRSISLIVPAEREDEEASILTALATGQTRQFDTVRRRKDGREIDVSVTTSPVRDAAGSLIGISKVARDITERKRAERDLARAKQAAEAASAEFEAFSYSVAHDLRAPLRGMAGFARLLVESYGDKLNPDGHEWLTEILGSAQRMGELIDALLSLSRVVRLTLNTEAVDLSPIARALLAQLAIEEPARVHEIAIADHLWADLDPRLARVLIDNLVRNAWKFTSKRACARIELGARDADGTPVFFLRDNGAGFDMAYASMLFAPFQRLHAGTEFPGTGIGLATVQRIVERHGGRIWADGVVDGGATFYFCFPGVSDPGAS